MKNELQLNIFCKKEANWLNGFLYVLIGFLIALLLFFNVFSLCGVKGASMYSTLYSGQNVLLINSKNAKRGDIVVFKQDKPLIKRVVAAPNDSIAFVGDYKNNVYLYLLDKKTDCFIRQDEDYILTTPMKAYWFNHEKFLTGEYAIYFVEELAYTLQIDNQRYIINIDKDCYFVMGDNREDSLDSRSFGAINKSSLYGRLVLKLKKDSTLEKFFLFLYGENPTE